MKKKTSKTTTAKPVAKLTAKRGQGYGQLVTAISAINTQMVGRVATVANQALVLRNWMVGVPTSLSLNSRGPTGRSMGRGCWRRWRGT